MSTWWTGSSCQSVKFPASKFSSAPVVLVTAEHERLGIKHDASTTWVEDVTTSSFKVCIRELQNFDGPHERIKIDWIAFADLHQPLFREHGRVLFKNGHEPLKEFNYAFCKDIDFVKPYDVVPSVLITANHSTRGGNLKPEYNSISAWVEYINTTGFRACTKELFVKKHDPLSISYAVMPDVCEPGWSFFNGSCYLTSNTCESWTNATKKCQSMKANLVSIQSQEENIFVQHRRNSAKSWIGLNDIASEGAYRWVDGSSSQFRFWAKGQPNNLDGNQDCVHAIGIQNGYKWNDVKCSACHNFTCEKDYDECKNVPCLNGGTCVNKNNSYTCICTNNSFGQHCEGLGKDCADIMKYHKKSGVYTIKPDDQSPFDVFCDMTTGGGGWTVFQKRLDGSVDFYRGWTDYKNGFGDLKGEFWLGLDKINRLTKARRNTLRVDLEETNGNTAYAQYSYFAVSSAATEYRLSLGSYSGDAGDSLGGHVGYSFSTKDNDNDSWGSNCAQIYRGAWWYTACHGSNLNGRYLHGSHSSYADGVNWGSWKGHHYSAARSEMKVRPEDF